MRFHRYALRPLPVALIAASIFVSAAPPALANDLTPPGYPPGWNELKGVGPILYDFRPGCWGDAKRYWPEEKVCNMSSEASLPIKTETVVYEFKPGGGHMEPAQ